MASARFLVGGKKVSCVSGIGVTASATGVIASRLRPFTVTPANLPADSLNVI
jgi:hypothetical protein